VSLRDQDSVVTMEVLGPTGTILSVTEQGYGKRTDLDEYRVQSRGGVGIINIQTSEGTARSSAYPGRRRRCADADHAAGQDPEDGVEGHPHIGRATQGVRLIDIEGDDRAVSIAKLAEQEEPERDEEEKKDEEGQKDGE
jgi:DNA gyrase subunit A